MRGLRSPSAAVNARPEIAAILVSVAFLLHGCGEPPDELVSSTAQPLTWGADDRSEIRNTDLDTRAKAESVTLITGATLTNNGDGTFTIPTTPLTMTNDFTPQPLCATERFYNQPTAAAQCSAFLVAPDIMATASHCLPDPPWANLQFVFHYRMETDTTARTAIPGSDIYRGVELISRGIVTGSDVMLVRIDRVASNRRVAPIRRFGTPALGTPLSTIGHPRMLPQIFSTGATLKEMNSVGYGVNLDANQGASGSMVFNAAGLVEGILSNGPGASEYVGTAANCSVSRTCSDSTGCPGFMFANRISNLPLGLIPGYTATYFADVTGPGGSPTRSRADMIAVNWEGTFVRTSSGTGLLSAGNWTGIGFIGTQGEYFADVTGDGKADGIVSNDHGITVRRSSGTAFSGNESWASGPYVGQYGNYFADVTGDGKADAIVINDFGVTVRRSTGAAPFSGNETWLTGRHVGRYGNYFARVNSDASADLILVDEDGIRVGISSGSGFAVPVRWTTTRFVGSHGNYFADLTGDGRADAISVSSTGITVRRSTGTGFAAVETWISSGFSPGTRGRYFADVTGDGLADAIVVDDDNVWVRASDGLRFSSTAANWFAASGVYGNAGVFPSSLH